MAPPVYPDHKFTWINENQKTTYALFSCIARGDCTQNQTKVVLISSFDFIIPMEGGYIGGEPSGRCLRALNNMGYSVLYATNIESALHLYYIYGHLVKMVIASGGDIEQHTSLEIFRVPFWSQAAHPLGSKWTLSPEDYHTNSYLGYSIEAQCSRYPFIPHSERKRQAYILAKFLNFFTPEQRVWEPDFFDAAATRRECPSIENIAPAHAEDVFTQDEFYHVLSHSVALVGVGNPVTSPTPYDALCLGIPFVNPVASWDENDPTDRTKWSTQHDPLKELSAPYVYHVFKGDATDS
ncbi:hypothetical protein B0H14DRAFT_3515443 [Mycena olivaceomarginata]|nr:hypothetical protein B0H14DRAFT_3515443 [Mycena olivaceomarginata]